MLEARCDFPVGRWRWNAVEEWVVKVAPFALLAAKGQQERDLRPSNRRTKAQGTGNPFLDAFCKRKVGRL